LIHATPFEVAPVPNTQSCYVPQAFTAEGCQVGMCDGSVQMISPQINATTWWRLCLPNDGFPIGDIE